MEPVMAGTDDGGGAGKKPLREPFTRAVEGRQAQPWPRPPETFRQTPGIAPFPRPDKGLSGIRNASDRMAHESARMKMLREHSSEKQPDRVKSESIKTKFNNKNRGFER